MPDPNVNTVFTAQDKMSATVKKVRGELAGFQKSVGGVKGAIPIFDRLGAATGGLINPTTLAIGGVVALGAGLIDAAKAAAAEEVNVAKLGAALKANIAGWDGNTDAIEANIRAGERLAFSDDAQRESLALLVAATHDVTEAQKIQATAMDLARLKGISLEEASAALIKVEAGQFRALKGLGIVLKEGATRTEALAAVQEVAAGQAEAYAKTTTGATDRLANSFDNLQESVGRLVAPSLADAATSLANVADAADQAGSVLGDVTVDGVNPFTAGIAAAGDTLKFLLTPLLTVGDALGSLNAKTSDSVQVLDRAQDGFGGLEDATKDTTRQFRRAYDAADDLAGALEDVKQQSEDAAEAMAEAIYGPDILQGRLAELEQSAIDTRRELKKLSEKKDLTAEDRRELERLQGELAETQSDILSTATKLKMLGEPIPPGVINSINRMIARQDVYNDKVQTAINRWRRLLGLIESGGEITGPINVTGGPTPRASGGPVRPGQTYLVGERGPELLHMGMGNSGTVTPNAAIGGGGMVTVPIVLQLDGDVIYRSVERRLVRDLRTGASMTR